MQYKLQKIDDKVCSVLLIDENKTIPFDLANSDYQAYLKWLDEGNTPLPADE
jgi:hypothetical protein